MKTWLISAALAATILAGGSTALAQNASQDAPPPPREGLFLHADANHDGIVTRQEFLADVDARFARVDTNHDGKITPDERKATFERMGIGGARRMHKTAGPKPAPDRADHGPRMDANNDGVVTLEEANAPALRLFNYVDRNGDGQIDKAERESFRDATMALRGPGGPGHHGRHGGRHGRHGPPPAGAPEAPPGQ